MTTWTSKTDVPQLALISASLMTFAAAALVMPAGATTQSHYGVTISKQKTKNMTFGNGVYSATADRANLNFNDLQTALASGNVEVTTGNGTGGDEMGDLHINVGFTWTSKHALTLDAYRSIFVNGLVVDAGKGALTLTDNDGGTGGDFNYAAKGSIVIWNLGDVLTIKGQRYLLDGSIQSLAGDIQAKPAGYYALAGNYDASKDGTYTGAPIAIEFDGTFEGLGNTISNLTVVSGAGLFYKATGTLRDVHLVNVAVTGTATDSVPTGALVGWGLGLVDGATSSGSVSNNNASNPYPVGGLVGDGNIVTNCSSTATVQSNGFGVGGLVGYVGTVSNSSATGSVKITSSGPTANVGGLVGLSNGGVTGSFATGAVSAPDSVRAGGLVGYANVGAIANSYATGNVVGGHNSKVGGLIGVWGHDERANAATSYSTGAASGGANSWIGGLLGLDDTKAGCACFSDTYWDTTTSGITNLAQGAGFPPNDPGIAGLTTAQLQAGLPAGFDPAIWAQNPSINNGLPYLIATPPQ